jgi:hypothetical protein
MNKIFIPTQSISKLHSSKIETKLDHSCLATKQSTEEEKIGFQSTSYTCAWISLFIL